MAAIHSILLNPMSGKQIDDLALGYIRKFQPEVLRGQKAFDIEKFAEIDLERLMGVQVSYSDDLPPLIPGLTDSASSLLEVRKELAEDPLQENYFRSTLAHETGHCIIHVPLLRKAKRTQIFKQGNGEAEKFQLYRSESIPIYKNPEWHAWRFAQALLMPEGPLIKLISQEYGLSEIANFFKVSPSFLKTRLRGLGFKN